jgi:hypothetical protein
MPGLLRSSSKIVSAAADQGPDHFKNPYWLEKQALRRNASSWPWRQEVVITRAHGRRASCPVARRR